MVCRVRRAGVRRAGVRRAGVRRAGVRRRRGRSCAGSVARDRSRRRRRPGSIVLESACWSACRGPSAGLGHRRRGAAGAGAGGWCRRRGAGGGAAGAGGGAGAGAAGAGTTMVRCGAAPPRTGGACVCRGTLAGCVATTWKSEPESARRAQQGRSFEWPRSNRRAPSTRSYPSSRQAPPPCRRCER